VAEAPSTSDSGRFHVPDISAAHHRRPAVAPLVRDTYARLFELKFVREVESEKVREAFLEGIENNLPQQMRAWNLTYGELQAINPDLVMISITPFGQTGPYSGWNGYDLNAFQLPLVGPPLLQSAAVDGLAHLVGAQRCGRRLVAGGIKALRLEFQAAIGEQGARGSFGVAHQRLVRHVVDGARHRRMPVPHQPPVLVVVRGQR